MNATCARHQTPRRTLAPGPGPRSEYVSAWEIAIVAVLLLLLILGVLATASGPQSHVSNVRTIRVEPGQTMWSIARSNPVPGLTTQQTVELIARTNNLECGAVAAQTSLKVPVAASERLVAQR